MYKLTFCVVILNLDIIQKKRVNFMMSLKEWIDEYFFNSSVDLEILRKAYNALVNDENKVNNLDEMQDDTIE